MIQKFPAELLEVQVELEVGESSEVGVSVRESGKERTRIGYMTALREVWVDRTESGKSEFHENFAGKHSARLNLKDGGLFLHVLIDSSSVEVLAVKGRVAITGWIFPCSDSRCWSLFGGKGARVVRWLLGNLNPVGSTEVSSKTSPSHITVVMDQVFFLVKAAQTAGGLMGSRFMRTPVAS